MMGVGMQIVYQGFAGSPQIEAEAGAQFVRLARFGKYISGCHLAIEASSVRLGHRMYSVRLDLITRQNDLIPVKRRSNEDLNVALCMAFDAAVRQLERSARESGNLPVSDKSASLSAAPDPLILAEETITYHQILVAMDGSESSKRALIEAIRMASLAHGKITAAYVVDSSAPFNYAGEYDPIALTRALRVDGERMLADACSQMAEHDIAGVAEIVETEGLSEDIASCLQRTAQRIGADLAVLGTHGRRGFRRTMIGNVAERFVRFATCPVLLVREKQPAPAA
jgi:nucleotide-binding universal stress UspA family protein